MLNRLFITFVFILSELAYTQIIFAGNSYVNYKGIKAYLSQNYSCDAIDHIRIEASNEAVFNGNRLELQRLLGGVRARLNHECQNLKEIKVLGKINDKQVFQGVMSASNSWQLTETKPHSSFEMGLPHASRQSFRCGNAHLTKENNALWPVLGEWEGVSESGKNVLLYMVGCDGRITTFKRPAQGNYYFKTTLSSNYHFEHAPNPYVINVPTPSDINYPEKQVGMTLHNKDSMTFDIEHFNPVNLKRTSREICLQSAAAIEQSADIALSPQYYFPELKKEREPLRQLFRAIEKRESWQKAKQKITDGLIQSILGGFPNKRTGEYQSIDDILGTVGVGNHVDNLMMDFANTINVGSHIVARFLITLIAAESDAYVRNLIDSSNPKSLMANLSGTLCQMKLIEEYYWEHIENIRDNDCLAKYGSEGFYPLNTVYPVMPFSPIEIEQFLPAASATRDKHMADSVSALLDLAKKYQTFECPNKQTHLN